LAGRQTPDEQIASRHDTSGGLPFLLWATGMSLYNYGVSPVSPWSAKMKTIAILNEKGGTAKTTTSVNLAASLGEMGKKVLLVDLDGQAASSRWLGVEGDTRLADALLTGSGLVPIDNVLPGVSLAPASGKLDSISHNLRPTQGSQLRRVLAEVKDRYDYILIDCPPSLGNPNSCKLAATASTAESLIRGLLS